MLGEPCIEPCIDLMIYPILLCGVEELLRRTIYLAPLIPAIANSPVCIIGEVRLRQGRIAIDNTLR